MRSQVLPYEEGCILRAFNIRNNLIRRLVIVDSAHQSYKRKEGHFSHHYVLMASFPHLTLLN